VIDPAPPGRRPGAPLRSPVALFGILILFTTLAACGAASQLPAGSQLPAVSRTSPATTLHLAEYRITPAQLTLDSGSYTFTAVNEGTISHALELTGNGVDGHTPDLAFEPGHSENFTITLGPGTYQFFCPVDAHRGLGMLGTLVVH